MVWSNPTKEILFLIKHGFWTQILIYDFFWLICFHLKTFYMTLMFLFFWFHKSILYIGFYDMRQYVYLDVFICVLIILFVCEWYLAYLSFMLAHMFAMIFISYILYGILIGGAIPISFYMLYSPMLIDRGSFRSLHTFISFLMLSKGEKYCEYILSCLYACEL